MFMSKLNFNAKNEKDVVKEIYENAILCLNEEDKNLPAIELMLPLLQRGIVVHHSGRLPIIKEVVELLIQEGLVKALFVIKIFAMGLNMHAKTVVFTSVRKWDGDSHRIIRSGEYIQMSGRVGRRGKDERGICIIMNDEQMEMNTLKNMVLGKPVPLTSTFRLSYYYILNLICRADGQFTAEHVIRNSFYLFQYEKVRPNPFMTFINSLFVLVYYLISTFLYYVHAFPDIGERVSKFKKEAAILDAYGKVELAEYHKLILDIAQLEKKMMSEIIRPERVLYFLLPGRLLQEFRNELKNRSQVLKKLGHIDADGVVQLKGQAACLIDTGDELLIAE
ncbi:hypothetical protein GIB67_001426 [Kingdonia uniflora]|uniref:Helicase C-terminal domain-containing protein n=1 Tax=Kingdonia uniflora TaxID=39325 RepID=A0A7J7L6K4_9MAGN|nr:hypothetical protein GIB67_001426 [Kingdonia uniflora]